MAVQDLIIGWPNAQRRPGRAWPTLVVSAALAFVGEAARSEAMLPTIGMSLPLSGSQAQIGRQMRAGAEACLRSAGAGIRLEVLDDGGSPERAASNMKTLAEQAHIVAALGGANAQSSLAMLPAATAAALPIIDASDGVQRLPSGDSNLLFHTRASYQDEGAAATNLLEELAIDSYAILHAESEAGRAGAASLRVEAARQSKRLVLMQAIPSDGRVDAIAKAIVAAAPGAVVLIAPPEQAAAFVRSARAAGLRSRILGLSETSSGRLATDLGPAAAGIGVSQVFPYPWSAKLPLVREYAAAMGAQGSGQIGYESLSACIGVRLAAEAIRRAGRTATRASVYAALDNGSYDLGGYVLSFKKGERRGSHFVEMTVIGSDGSTRH